MDINITNPVTTSKIGEVVNGASAATPNDTDLVPIVESSLTKKITLTNLKAFLKTYFDTLYSALTASSFGTFINGLTSKTTPVDADELVISDSAASNVAKKVTGTNFKAYLKTYFDTIYTTTSAVATQITTALSGYLTSATAATTYAPIASPTFTGTATTPAIIVSSETASRVAIIDASKNVKSADTATYPSLTELAYVKGVTSAIQTQLNGKGYVVASRYYATINPTDSTTYYTAYVFASNLTTSGAGTIHKTLKSGTSINVGWTHTCVAGSNEGVTLKVTNKTTAVTITITTSIDMSNANVNNTYLAQALTYSVGDQLEVTIETPAWVTNPTSVRFNVDLHLV